MREQPNVSTPILIASASQFEKGWRPTQYSYCPQPIEMLQARFPKAVDHVHYVSEDIRKPVTEWCCNDPAHVFDFEDGLRLIASRDREHRDGAPGLIPSLSSGPDPETIHISASVRPGSPILLESPLISRAEFQKRIIDHLEPISNFVGDLIDCYISEPPKRVLHLWFREIR